MSDTVTLPAEAAMFLVAGHINMLASADEDEGCCPVCCGPCAALKTLLDAGQLDDIVRTYGSQGWDWWDAETGQVDRGLLARAWRMTQCHNTAGRAQ